MASAQLAVGSGLQGLLKDGYKETSGVEMAVLRNIEACKKLTRLTRTSLGPYGMHKLLINHLGKVFVTSNTNTIISELEVAHPAAKLLVLAADTQHKSHGDHTNFVLAFAGELLTRAEQLIQQGIHVSDVITGYEMAAKYASDNLHTLVVENAVFNFEDLQKAIKSVVGAKQPGNTDLLAKLVSEACGHVLSMKGDKPYLNVDNVRVAKLMGGSAHMSSVIKGLVIRRPAESMVKKVKDAKIAVFATNIEAAQTETKGTVRLTSADELLNYAKTEERLLEDQIKGIKESGVTVVVSGGTISQMAQHYIDKYDLLAVKITSKFELRRICRAVGATPLVRIGAVLPEEMGYCDEVYTREIAGGKCVIFEQTKEDSGIATILFRSATTNILDDLERAADSGVSCVKTLCEDPRLLPGGGCCDIGLARLVMQFGEKAKGLEQYAIKDFAKSLEVVPRILVENSGKKATEVIAKMYADREKGLVSMGFDSASGEVVDVVKESIFDSYSAKYEALRLAADAAATVLRVDQLIMSKVAGGPKLPPQ